jgi:hypothetical protein
MTTPGNNALKDAMYRYLHGDGEVEDITARYFPEEAKVTPKPESCISGVCEVSCQAGCELVNEQQQKDIEMGVTPLKDWPKPKPKQIGRPKVIKEEDKVFCTDCRYYIGARSCAVARKKVRDPITGTWSDEGDTYCFNDGDCSKHEEIPDCTLKFASYEKHLYKFKVLRVFWDSDKQTWQKKLGIKRGDDL